MVVIGAGLLAVALVSPGSAQAQGPIKIGLVQGISGPFEVYAKQIVTGFKLGLEYATGGKLEVLGRKIEVLVEDDQLKPDVAKRLVTKLYADDKVRKNGSFGKDAGRVFHRLQIAFTLFFGIRPERPLLSD